MLFVVGGLWLVAGGLFAAAQRGARADAARLGVPVRLAPVAHPPAGEWGVP
jgi:hypothetical protein